MKKQTVVLIALLVLPVLAVAIAISPASVTVIEGETLRTTTYGEAVVGSAVGWCAPVALIMIYGLFAAAVIYGLSKKLFWMKAIRVVSFLAMTISVLPILIQTDVIVIPNALVGLVLGVDCLISHFSLKKSMEEKNKQTEGRRLSNI